MKKLFTLLMLMVCAIGTAWAGDVFTVSLNNGATQTRSDGKTGDFFTVVSGGGYNTKYTGTYNGTTYTKGLKINSSSNITFTTAASSTIIIVQSAAANSAKRPGVNGNALTDTDITSSSTDAIVYTLSNQEAGTYKLDHTGGEWGCLFVSVEYTGSILTQLTAPSITFDAETGEVEISPVENATKITYTTDGNDPTAESEEYKEAFTVGDGVIVKAIAIGDNESYSNSSVASDTVFLAAATIAAPVIKQFNGTVAITCETAGTTIEYSLDGENYTTYSRAFTLTENGTVYARAKRGDKTSESVNSNVTTISKGEANKTIYLSFGAFTLSEDNQTLTGATGNAAEGFVITMDQTGQAKTFGSGNKITTKGGDFTTIKGSNGRQIKVDIPSSVTATRLTLYSYQNATGSVSGWKEVGGQDTEYTSIPMGAYGEDTATPDVRVYKLENLSGTTLTFNNAGVQLCFVAALDVIESQDPTLKATSEIALKAVPYNKTSTATITLTGNNLTDGTYDVTLPSVDGLSIAPTSFTVTDGAVEQTFTVTYTSEADVESQTASITFAASSAEATTTVSYQSRGTLYELTEVSEAKKWDWETLTEKVELTKESTPTLDTEFVLKELEGRINFGTFDAQSIKVKAQYPSNSKKFQNGTIAFKTTVPGKVVVDFSDTGSSVSATATPRYLIVNGQNTGYWTCRPTEGETKSSDRKKSGEIFVPAGEVSITGSQALCIYSVEFTPAEAPTITATITAAGYATFSSLFEVEIPDGVEAYYASASEGSTVTMTSIDGGVIPAGTGVVLKGAEGSYTMAVSNTGATLDGTNLLKANIADRTPIETEYYTLAAGPTFKKSTGGILAAGKAYLVLPSASARIDIVFDGEATGISEQKTTTEDNTVYNLNGIRVSQPTKGLYIKNGKKFVR